MAAEQDQLIGGPGHQERRICKRGKVRPVAWSGARQGQVRLERPGLWLQPGSHALRLNLPGQLAGVLSALADVQPDHADQPAALERSELAKRQLEGRQTQ